jgi:hypothetical protein
MGLTCSFRRFLEIFFAKRLRTGFQRRVLFRHIRFVQYSVNALDEPYEPHQHAHMAHGEAALRHQLRLPHDCLMQCIGARMQLRQHRIAGLNIQLLKCNRLTRRHAQGPPLASAHYAAGRGCVG